MIRSDHEIKQFPAFVAYQVELEAEEPSHGAFASPGNAFESLVNMDPLVFAYSQRGLLSTKLMPVHLPSRTFFMNRASGMATSFSSSTKRL